MLRYENMGGSGSRCEDENRGVWRYDLREDYTFLEGTRFRIKREISTYLEKDTGTIWWDVYEYDQKVSSRLSLKDAKKHVLHLQDELEEFQSSDS